LRCTGASDGTLPLPRLGDAVRAAQQTAQAEQGPGPLAAAVERLRAQALGPRVDAGGRHVDRRARLH